MSWRIFPHRFRVFLYITAEGILLIIVATVKCILGATLPDWKMMADGPLCHWKVFLGTAKCFWGATLHDCKVISDGLHCHNKLFWGPTLKGNFLYKFVHKLLRRGAFWDVMELNYLKVHRCAFMPFELLAADKAIGILVATLE